jgi:hypothetical protein
MRFRPLSAAVLFAAPIAIAAAGLNASEEIGSVLEVRQTALGAEVHAHGGSIHVEFTEPTIVRITASRQREFPVNVADGGMSYVENPGRATLPVRIIETTEGWRIAPHKVLLSCRIRLVR